MSPVVVDSLTTEYGFNIISLHTLPSSLCLEKPVVLNNILAILKSHYIDHVSGTVMMMAESSSSDTDLIVADLSDSRHKLICIEFPGIIENETAAIERLGGTDAVSKAHIDGRRLELKFRPDDQYCKPALSKTVTGSNLILKVKRKRLHQRTPCILDGINDRDLKYEYAAELIGISNKTYQFSGMADYQILPPGLNRMEHKGMPVDPNDFQMKEPLNDEFCKRDIPSFLPPGCFSKFDKPLNYTYRPYFKLSKSGPSEDISLPPPSKSKKKFNLAYSLNFDSIGVPKEPNPDAISSINPNNPLIFKIRELFKERPVWSRTALQWRIKSTQTKIRSVLPLIAYNFSSGPFKRLWIKLGYDPRSDPCNKIYQGLDIRIPKEVTCTELQNRSHSGASTSIAESNASTEHIEETAFRFIPDRLPSQRQLCYQLCDIQDQEGQDLIHHNDGKESECTEVNGWCEENTYDKLRKMLTAKIKLLAEKGVTGV